MIPTTARQENSLQSAGSELFEDSENYLTELSEDEMSNIGGAGSSYYSGQSNSNMSQSYNNQPSSNYGSHMSHAHNHHSHNHGSYMNQSYSYSNSANSHSGYFN